MPLVKVVATPPRGLRGRGGWLGYWLRRPEPSLLAAAVFTVLFAVSAVVERDWVPLVGGAICGAGGLFVWLFREGAVYNAERWRQGYEDVF
ncbi:hypothetical protein [Micromonospora thermarum]|uniref:Uncharacterized protein n=1 Tax=Micromonospora thermarum TaxID=2720024 RepID=A0ABX0ZI18_9ACTN|nr:hypothetical protein [Micromonospora thermarum]NJP35505.1 hypothetical protein [Micromonospora thermarum]